jgi:hypothetical protein
MCHLELEPMRPSSANCILALICGSTSKSSHLAMSMATTPAAPRRSISNAKPVTGAHVQAGLALYDSGTHNMEDRAMIVETSTLGRYRSIV